MITKSSVSQQHGVFLHNIFSRICQKGTIRGNIFCLLAISYKVGQLSEVTNSELVVRHKDRCLYLKYLENREKRSTV